MRRLMFAAALALAACDAQVGHYGASDGSSQSSDAVAVPASLPAYFDCLRERGFTAISAHSGGPARGFAENAIPTFENTLRVAPGAFLEVDMSQTADGVLVLMHDDRADRTTTGTGAIADLDMAQLLTFQLEDDSGQRVDARVPTLADALEWADGKTVLELDIKRGVRFEDVISVVQAANAMSRVVFVTYSVDGAARLARLAPQAMIYTTITSARDLDTLQRRGVDLSHIVAWLGDGEVDEVLLQDLNARGVEGRWGMFDRNADFTLAAELGVQGAVVNDPVAAYRAIDAGDGQDGFAAAQCAR